MNEEQMKYVANLISQDLEKDKEINRLNNIINELEKWVREDINYNSILGIDVFYPEEILDKLKELKENKR